jgi:hypothetical protein
MKKMIFLGWLVVFLPGMAFAQEKIEAPLWNVGDKWVFTQGNIEVVGADQNSYTMKFPSDKTNAWLLESGGFEKIIFEKGTLNRIYALKETKREKYKGFRRTHLNFPFNPGKKWKDIFSATPLVGYAVGMRVLEYTEAYAVLGWEEVQVPAGKFRAIKLECEQVVTGPPGYMGQAVKAGGKAWYWYSPAGKYFVKCQYDELNFRPYVVNATTSFTLN